jgi:hypothetical protein
MGSVVPESTSRRHTVEVEAWPAPGQDRVRVELIGRGGAVLFAREFKGGRLSLSVTGSDGPGYLLARAFGAGEAPGGTVKLHAITNPVYLHPAGFARRPATTLCRIAFQQHSPWIGGTIAWETADGTRIDQAVIQAGRIERRVPADSRIRLQKAGRRERVFYIATENPAVERCVQYLSLGQFRNDYPDIPQGQVPPAAFRLKELEEAIRQVELEM